MDERKDTSLPPEESTDMCPFTTKDGDKHLKILGIPLVRKICYAVGGMPYQLSQATRTFFGQIFLLDVVQLSPFYVFLIMILCRVWDAITDPIVGYMISKSRKKRIGKLIPWIVFSMPFAVVSYIMMWFVPWDSMSQVSTFLWVFIWTCLFDLCLSCQHVSYSSLNMFLGGDQKSRDSATAFRMGMEMFAVVAGATIQGQIVGIYHAKRALTCSQVNYSDTSLLNLSSPTVENITSTLTDSHQNARMGYVVAALVLASLYFLSCLVLFLGVKEHLAPLSTLDRIKMPYLVGMKMVVKHTPYVRLMLGFFFSAQAFHIHLGNLALFCTHAADLGAYLQHIILILTISAALSIPLWQTLQGRLGKKTTLLIGLSILAPALAVMVCVRSSLPVFAPMTIIAGSSLGSIYLLPWSMLPDAVDDFKVKNPSSKDLEPMFYSYFLLFNKLGSGLTLGLSTLVLHFAGYKPGACRHQPAVVTALQVLFAPVPIALLLTGMLIIFFYPINDERLQQIQRELQKAA